MTFEHGGPDDRPAYTELPTDETTAGIDGDAGYDAVTSDDDGNDIDDNSGLGEGDAEHVRPHLEVHDRAEPADRHTLQTVGERLAGLFANKVERPKTADIASLIKDGMTEGDIIEAGLEAGYDEPIMDLTLQDTDTVSPYIADASDTIAEGHEEGTKVAFAQRDADLLGDDYVTAHPGKDAVFLPASQLLFKSFTRWDEELVQDFLAELGIDEEWVHDPDRMLRIEDTGYRGTIAAKTGKLISDAFEVDPAIIRAKIDIKLVASLNDRVGEIMPVQRHPSEYSQGLPKLNNIIGDYTPLLEGALPNSWRFAGALQLMPKFHGHYNRFGRVGNGRAVALPDDQRIDRNVDVMAARGYNALSYARVNPVAATVAQFRIVRNALRRTGQL